MNEVLKTIKSRRSVRSYLPNQIKPEELHLIIEAGIYAPTAHNDQPWHFTVIQNKELLSHINEKTKELMIKSENEFMKSLGSNPKIHVIYNAPTLIIVSGKKDALDPKTDCSAAIENMLIAAESLNIGSVWLSFLTLIFSLPDEIKKFDIPEGYEPYYGVAFGCKNIEKELTAPTRNVDVINFIS
jgi:nitroreductase